MYKKTKTNDFIAKKMSDIGHFANEQVKQDLVDYHRKAILLASMLDSGYITVQRTSKQGNMTDEEWENFTSSPMYSS